MGKSVTDQEIVQRAKGVLARRATLIRWSLWGMAGSIALIIVANALSINSQGFMALLSLAFLASVATLVVQHASSTSPSYSELVKRLEQQLDQ